MRDKMNSNAAPKTTLGKIGQFIVNARWFVIAAAILLTIVSAIFAVGTVGQLTLSRFEVPGSESDRASQVLANTFDTGNSNLILLVTAKSGTIDSREVHEAGTALTNELEAEETVVHADSYWTRDRSSTLRSEDGRQALILAHMKGSATEVRQELSELSPKFTREDDLLKVEVGGQDEIFRQVGEFARQDFVRAELIIFPAVFFMLLIMFRRVRLALLTLGVGLFAMIATLAGLSGVVAFTEVSTFALNLTLVMGLALGIDYSLFIPFSRGAGEWQESV
ncbi:RND superfamily putative drug exporter [Bacillus capparidis]|uniref:RND superfamily putative drug exporter n=1 Tax=Bacillus capparidis TaxID=1840411 RepID=A0ABS4CUI7_9BACI|nr:RND superfamily putative drug exporter [Bacillus capparidis]